MNDYFDLYNAGWSDAWVEDQGSASPTPEEAEAAADFMQYHGENGVFEDEPPEWLSPETADWDLLEEILEAIYDEVGKEEEVVVYDHAIPVLLTYSKMSPWYVVGPRTITYKDVDGAVRVFTVKTERYALAEGKDIVPLDTLHEINKVPRDIVACFGVAVAAFIDPVSVTIEERYPLDTDDVFDTVSVYPEVEGLWAHAGPVPQRAKMFRTTGAFKNCEGGNQEWHGIGYSYKKKQYLLTVDRIAIQRECCVHRPWSPWGNKFHAHRKKLRTWAGEYHCLSHPAKRLSAAIALARKLMGVSPHCPHDPGWCDGILVFSDSIARLSRNGPSGALSAPTEGILTRKPSHVWQARGSTRAKYVPAQAQIGTAMQRLACYVLSLPTKPRLLVNRHVQRLFDVMWLRDPSITGTALAILRGTIIVRHAVKVMWIPGHVYEMRERQDDRGTCVSIMALSDPEPELMWTTTLFCSLPTEPIHIEDEDGRDEGF